MFLPSLLTAIFKKKSKRLKPPILKIRNLAVTAVLTAMFKKNQTITGQNLYCQIHLGEDISLQTKVRSTRALCFYSVLKRHFQKEIKAVKTADTKKSKPSSNGGFNRYVQKK